jgi:hypothetical protein
VSKKIDYRLRIEFLGFGWLSSAAANDSGMNMNREVTLVWCGVYCVLYCGLASVYKIYKIYENKQISWQPIPCLLICNEIWGRREWDARMGRRGRKVKEEGEGKGRRDLEQRGVISLTEGGARKFATASAQLVGCRS